ncbi:MAG TPA: ABC transporter permease subunit [Armatimonadota bacterium]|nr:ABC transporter permease subunit [Armatimonadota bacterium]
MITLVKLEIFKLVRRARSYLGFAALSALAGLVVLGLKEGPPPFEQSINQVFMTFGNILNGGFTAWFLLKLMMALFLPLFACVVIGDMVSGEANDGTLRTMLSRPVGRGKILFSKFIVSVLYVIALTFFIGVAGYMLGAIFLGRGALVTFQEGTALGAQGIYIYPEAEGLLRLLGAYAYASVAVLSVASIAFFISAFVTNSLGAIGGAMVLYIASNLLGIIKYFEPIKDYLFTTHMGNFGLFFINEIPKGDLLKSLGILFAYILAFLAAGLFVFHRKDVLS